MESATFQKSLFGCCGCIEWHPANKPNVSGIAHALVRRGEHEAELLLAGSPQEVHCNPTLLQTGPHTAPVSRLDEVKAARQLVPGDPAPGSRRAGDDGRGAPDG
jgi:hypothetical protein